MGVSMPMIRMSGVWLSADAALAASANATDFTLSGTAHLTRSQDLIRMIALLAVVEIM